MFAFHRASSHVSFNNYVIILAEALITEFKVLLSHITLFQEWKVFQLKAQ